ncbi:MAG: hypothetical protein IE931_12050 [Sphingobacteriales bacterium]|nr:hypothetical protein [Sphingobacteriales bacterium]
MGELTKGTVLDENNHQVSDVIIQFYTIQDSLLIGYTSPTKFGHFTYVSKAKLDSIIIIVRGINYKTFEKKIYLLDNINVEIKLETKTQVLNEVVILDDFKGIRVRNDTTIYSVKNFKSDEDFKIEDILKKLPGISVSDNGNVSFKGKPIETILIDGENIFKNNYSIASKNINPNLIKDIIAIENYVDNPVLKDLSTENNTVIDLKVDPEKKKFFFGNFSASLGLNKKKELNGNLFSYQKKHKFYLINGYNNIGNYLNVYDLIDNNEAINDIETSQTITQFTPKTFDLLNNNYQNNINNELLISLIHIYNPNDKFKVKNNLVFDSNNLSNTNNSLNKYLLGSQNISFEETQKVINKLTNFDINTNFTYTPRENSVLKFGIDLNNKNLFNSADLLFSLSNNPTSFILRDTGILKSFKSNLDYSTKINQNMAFLTSITFENKNFPQKFNNESNSIDQNINQYSESKNINLRLVSRIKKILLVSNEIGLNNRINTFDVFRLSFNNLNKQITNDFYNTLFIKIEKGKFQFDVNNYLTLRKIDFNGSIRNFFLYQPKASFQYKLTRNHLFNFEVSNNKDVFSLEDIAFGRVQVDYRTIVEGLNNITIPNNNKISLRYTYSNLYNQESFFVNFTNLKTTNGLGYNLSLGSLGDSLRRIITPSSGSTIINAQIDKYVPFLKTKFRLESSNFTNNYFSLINPSESFSDIKTSTSNIKLLMTTVFKKGVNFSLGYQIRSNKFINSTFINKQNKIVTNNYILNGYLKVDKNTIININNSLIHQGSNSLLLSDINFTKGIKENKTKIFLNLRNIFNKTTIQAETFSTLSSQSFTYNLLGRVFVAGLNYNF